MKKQVKVVVKPQVSYVKCEDCRGTGYTGALITKEAYVNGNDCYVMEEVACDICRGTGYVEK